MNSNFHNSQSYYRNNSIKNAYIAEKAVVFMERGILQIIRFFCNILLLYNFFKDLFFIHESDEIIWVILVYSGYFFMTNVAIYTLMQQGVVKVFFEKISSIASNLYSKDKHILWLSWWVALNCIFVIVWIGLFIFWKMQNLDNTFSYIILAISAIIFLYTRLVLDDEREKVIGYCFYNILSWIVLVPFVLVRKIIHFFTVVLFSIFQWTINNLKKYKLFYSRYIDWKEVIESERNIYIIR